MTVIPEDGTGLATANSYVSTAEADAYFTARNSATWSAAATAAKEAALLEATSYLQGIYKGTWVGDLYSTEQALDWPRTGAYDPEGRPLDGVPQAVKDATCQLALEHVTNGSLQPSMPRSGRVKRRTIGPITTEFDVGAPGGRAFPFIDTLLAGITEARKNMIPLVRA